MKMKKKDNWYKLSHPSQILKITYIFADRNSHFFANVLRCSCSTLCSTFVLITFSSEYIKMASIATKFRPLFDRVLVKRLDAVKQSKGGIMLPESASKKILEATVVAVGPGARNQDGKAIPIDVKVGDRVLLPEYGGTKIQLDDDDSYTIFKESELLAKVEST